jgi:hypothetical protein
MAIHMTNDLEPKSNELEMKWGRFIGIYETETGHSVPKSFRTQVVSYPNESFRTQINGCFVLKVLVVSCPRYWLFRTQGAGRFVPKAVVVSYLKYKYNIISYQMLTETSPSTIHWIVSFTALFWKKYMPYCMGCCIINVLILEQSKHAYISSII